MLSLSDNQKIGVILVTIGCLFLMLGILLFFDAGLLAIGNILFLLGFPFIIGWERTLVFFNPLKRREKRGGIALFFMGIALVLMKRSFIGIIVELFGMVAMFGGLLPIVVSFLGAFPVIGPIVTSPAVTAVVSRLAGAARRPPV